MAATNAGGKKGGNKGGKKKSTKDFEWPEFMKHRMTVWDVLAAEQDEIIGKGESKPIKITLPDGAVKEGESWKTTPMDIAMGISQGLANACVAAKVNGDMWDLLRPFEGDSTLQLLKFQDKEGQHVFWHSSAHVLGQAMELKYRGKLCTGPATEDGGFYYDMRLKDGETVSPEDFKEIKSIVQVIVKEKQKYQRLVIPKERALEMFKYSPYKTDLINRKVPDGETCTAYRCGPLIDLCKGPHLPNTGRIKAFEIYQNSSAYWLGNAENDVLQRVYGISFPVKKQLTEWINIRKEAEKRDHRKIGTNQKLFFFDSVSPGSTFFLPHGTRIMDTMKSFMRRECRAHGFTEVITPTIFNSELWKTSGHWANYREDMFTFEVSEGTRVNEEGKTVKNFNTFGIKPMNCPAHCRMFGHEQRSYRDLPIRYCDFGPLHRNELHGALSGLTRVRRFCQDDGHIFCTAAQIPQEIAGAIAFLKRIYSVFGFDFKLELSTRPDKYLGDIATWDKAEKALEVELNKHFGEGKWKLNPGDGAFYGPKIDVHIMDALKREFQCATIQLDFQLPQRFKLKYAAADGSEATPVIIHRAVYGSFERFFAILIEHVAGKWPLWLSPRQAIVMTISQKSEEWGQKVYDQLFKAGFHVEKDFSGKKLNKKVLLAQNAQYNYMLVVGEKEAEGKLVNVRQRDGKVLGTKSVEEFIASMEAQIAEYK